ncbi:hypothetical protein GOP47_0008782 [Adiantum capillus-veneris]|uniref:Uncharacterized protein n=1 Tax=Adiantum capillus-veneris TaxID=13818 RepID=A0A9D4ZK18_ADICA|nr:hypothetical protein GOP47_0008782 [Adiantum capillus-veneris]
MVGHWEDVAKDHYVALRLDYEEEIATIQKKRIVRSINTLKRKEKKRGRHAKEQKSRMEHGENEPRIASVVASPRTPSSQAMGTPHSKSESARQGQ